MFRRIFYMVLFLLMHAMGLQAQLWRRFSNIADSFRQQKNADSAIQYYSLSNENITADSIYSDSYIQILTNLAILLYRSRSQYQEAEEIFTKARTIIGVKYGKENDGYATNANYLGQINYYLKHYQKAEAFYLEGMRIWERLHTKRSVQYASSCNALGILYNENGQFEKAESAHLEARSIRESLVPKDDGAYAQSCNNLAALYWNLGQYDKAEPLALEAKTIRGRVAGVPKSAYAISCVNLANIYRDMGKYSQAETLYIEARQVREDFFTKEHDDYALSCDILADLYYFMKQFNKAEPLYLEAKSIRERIGSKNSFFYAQSCSNLAAMYREMGRFQEGVALALEAGAILKNVGSPAEADIAVNNNVLGTLYYSMGSYDKAAQYFQLARDTWRRRLGESHPFFTESSLSLARLYRSKNEVAKANRFYVEAFGSQQEQAAKMFSFTSEDEKQAYMNNISGTADEYLSFYFEKMQRNNNGQPYNISLLKRNQILFSSMQLRQLIYNSEDTTLSKKYDSWISLKKQISALYSKGDKAPKEHLDEIKKEADLLEKDLVRSSMVVKKTAQTEISWKAIQQKLKSTEAAIEFIEFNYFNDTGKTDNTFYAALVLRKELKEPQWIKLFEKKSFDSIMANSGEGVNGINDFYSRGVKLNQRNNSVSQKVYNTIWKPLEQGVLKGVNKIYFSPAGVLHRVSFAALAVDSVNVLSDKYQLVQLSTTASVIEGNPDFAKRDDQVFLFGGIQYAVDSTKMNALIDTVNTGKSGFDYLPGTATEVNEIARIGRLENFSLRLVEGPDAREDVVKGLTGKQSPGILHIATHGFFFDDPQSTNRSNPLPGMRGGKVFQQADNPLFRSGLVFAGANDAWNGKNVEGEGDDGILTAYEVATLYLPNTKLVVLSACETALGDIKGSEGVYGLQRAFKIAGAKNLVMSLWKVPDAATAEFMQLFYKNMFDGIAIDKAFYEAQKRMKDKNRKDPYQWAAWILVR